MANQTVLGTAIKLNVEHFSCDYWFPFEVVGVPRRALQKVAQFDSIECK